jgi:hypothetical protein
VTGPNKKRHARRAEALRAEQRQQQRAADRHGGERGV